MCSLQVKLFNWFIIKENFTFCVQKRGEKIPILVNNDKNTPQTRLHNHFHYSNHHHHLVKVHTSTKQIIPISYLTRCVYSGHGIPSFLPI